MKSKLKVILPTLIFIFIGFLGYKMYNIIQHKKQVAASIKTMPLFSYQNINGKLFTNANLKENTPTIYIYYNSECDFCNHEAQLVKESIAEFKDVQLVFVSFEKLDKVKIFAKQYKLDNYDNVSFVSDTNLSFATTFDVKSMPAIVVYNKNNTLVQKLNGQIKLTKIIELLNAD